MSGIDSCIKDEDNDLLVASYRADEVLQALKAMGGTKVPGMDGFLAIFFQKF